MKLEEYYVLGMIGKNKEMLLFDRQIQISKKVEEWLVNVEDSMRISVKKHMKNGILRFSNQPIEEWILDYPQQVAISVLHLILCQEINDILSHAEYEAIDQDDDTAAFNGPKMHFHEEKVIIGKPDPAIAVAQALSALEGETTGNVSIAEEEKSEAEKLKESRLNRLTNRSKEPKVEYQATILKNRLSNEPPLDEEELQSQFLDDCFGEGVIIEHHLDRATHQMKKDEGSISNR